MNVDGNVRLAHEGPTLPQAARTLRLPAEGSASASDVRRAAHVAPGVRYHAHGGEEAGHGVGGCLSTRLVWRDVESAATFGSALRWDWPMSRMRGLTPLGAGCPVAKSGTAPAG